MIDKLFINGVNIQEQYGFFLEWKFISAPTFKANYQSIAGADSVINLTKANGRVFYNQRSVKLNMVHPNDEYQSDLDAIFMLHGEDCQISFLSDPNHYYSGEISVDGYDTKTHKLTMSALVYPYRFANSLTNIVFNSTGSADLENDSMPVTPKVQVIGGSATIAWKTYSKSLSAGTYYIDELYLDKNETVTLNVTLGTASSVKVSFRKGRL